MKDKALRLALEALERVMSHGQAIQEAKDIIREALAQPEAEQQEPVAWYDAEKDCAYTLSDCEGRAQDDLEPLYLAPPSNPWQGLTDEEIWDTPNYEETSKMYRFARSIEAKLKEKNT